MLTAELIKERNEYFPKCLYHSFKQPLKVSYADSNFYYTEDPNNVYIDLYNNVCHIGHSNPNVLEAVKNAYSTLNINTRYLTTSLTNYAKKLQKYIPDGYKIIFTNSGSESNDLALQMGINYYINTTPLIGAFERSYHGTTWLCDQVSHIDSRGNISKATKSSMVKFFTPEKKQNLEEVKVFILETIQGVGGNYDVPHEVIRHIRENTEIMICDEVQTGFGRSGGTFWAFEKANVLPDIITCGKPIANGYPMGACIFRADLEQYLPPTYFNTFGGNNVACDIAKVVLEQIEEHNYIKHSRDVGEYLKGLLKKIPEIETITGAGLYLGIKFNKTIDVKEIVEKLKDEEHTIVGIGYNSIMRIKPPMTVSKKTMDDFVQSLKKVLEKVEKNEFDLINLT